MEEIIIHEERVNSVLSNMIKEDTIINLADVFKVFSDTTRLKILCALKESELCVYDIAYITKSTQSLVSHQLKILKDFSLVKSRKEGKIVYYSLNDEHVLEIIMKGLEHIEEI